MVTSTIRLAEGVESRTIGLLVGGHSHTVVNTRVAGIPIVEAGSDGAVLAVADLVKTVAGGREVRTRIVPVSPDSVTANPAMAELVESYGRKADSLTSRVVATVKLPLARLGDQYRLGSLIAEARRNVLRADSWATAVSGRTWPPGQSPTASCLRSSRRKTTW